MNREQKARDLMAAIRQQRRIPATLPLRRAPEADVAGVRVRMAEAH